VLNQHNFLYCSATSAGRQLVWVPCTPRCLVTRASCCSFFPHDRQRASRPPRSITTIAFLPTTPYPPRGPQTVSRRIPHRSRLCLRRTPILPGSTHNPHHDDSPIHTSFTFQRRPPIGAVLTAVRDHAEPAVVGQTYRALLSAAQARPHYVAQPCCSNRRACPGSIMPLSATMQTWRNVKTPPQAIQRWG